MTDEYEKRSMFYGRRTDKTIYSRSFPDWRGQKLRIVSKVIDGEPGLGFATVDDELVLRVTPAGRYEVKATVFEDERRVKTLSIQRFTSQSGPLAREHFTLVGREIDTFLEFVAGIRTVPIEGGGKAHVTDDALRKIVLNKAQAEKLFGDHQELFVEIAQREDLQRDLIAVGYRRKQLDRFDRLLKDPQTFANEQAQLATGPEGVWQAFFDANTWIFGYGLNFQFLSKLDERRLEQVIRGYSVAGPGKRVDALLKTQGLVNSLCFVEIKRHDTSLLATKEYRPGAFPPSADLSGGVAQVQATVQDAVEQIGRTLRPTSSEGDPTGELLFNVKPRAYLVAGSLSEFTAPNGINEAKVRSFELYRRSLDCPEVLTFDELLSRARFIVEQTDQ